MYITNTHRVIFRVHQNDIENVIPFVLIGALYCLTGPDPASAKLHFQIFTAARILHTLSYQVKRIHHDVTRVHILAFYIHSSVLRLSVRCATTVQVVNVLHWLCDNSVNGGSCPCHCFRCYLRNSCLAEK